jgi:hypothetical protein
VVFASGRRLTCKVVPPQPGDQTVRVVVGPEEQGSLLLPLASIDRIEYDYQSQLQSLDEEDYEGHYRLGLWCYERQLYAEGLARLLHARGKEGVPPAVHLHLGRVYEALPKPDFRAALQAYEQYLETAPDGELAPAAREGVERVRKAMEKYGITEEEEQPAAAEPTGDDGLETADWQKPDWSGQSNPARLSRPVIQGTTGNRVLRAEYRYQEGLPLSEAKAPVQLSLNRNLETTPVLSFNVYNPEEKPVEFSVALATGQGYVWHESPPIRVPPKAWKTDQRLDLRRPIWKTRESNWQHNAPVGALDRTRNLIFLIYNGKREGTLYFDAIRFGND